MENYREEIKLPWSKSLRNREWILRFLSQGRLSLCEPQDESDDSLRLHSALQGLQSRKETVFDCGNAGTVARFLLALLSTRIGEYQLIGSARLYERPMSGLIDALRTLGAGITCLGKEGFFPVRVQGGKLRGGTVEMQPSPSSQFISALLLIGSEYSEPLTLRFSYPSFSQPYIDQTVGMVNRFGGNIVCHSQGYYLRPVAMKVPVDCPQERDWSSASYFYGMLALLQRGEFYFPQLSLRSLQGDRVVADMFAPLGVVTRETPLGIVIKTCPITASCFRYDFSGCPDLLPTMAVVLSLLHIPAVLTGVESLAYKESDRLSVLLEGLTALGYGAAYDGRLVLTPAYPSTEKSVTINTRNDHRMVMAFALATRQHPYLTLTHLHSVEKSFPSFWEYAARVGRENRTIQGIS